jgi:hypothetical protein
MPSRNKLLTKPVFVLLLPVFFVFHGFSTNFDSVPLDEALLLVFEYLVVITIITAIAWLFFRDLLKAGIMALVVMTIFFFFGSLKHYLLVVFPGSLIGQYRFLIPFFFLLILGLFLFLKKKNGSFFQISSYLNILLATLMVIDVIILINRLNAVSETRRFNASRDGFTICDSCSKPDIFLIIPDQYSGKELLEDLDFDNAVFLDQLKIRGFHVANKSRSNYNLTPFSVASVLDMNYLPGIKKGNQTLRTLSYCYNMIKHSRAIKFLNESGYQFYNCSLFDFPQQPAHRYESFLPYGRDLITAQTLWGRLVKDLEPGILRGKWGSAAREKAAYRDLGFNDEMIRLTGQIAAQQSAKPKFVYTHLMMPHFPYYFDSNGRPQSLDKVSAQQNNVDDYLEYLQYCNRRLLQLVDQILSASPHPPVILLLSDHGLQVSNDPQKDFINMNAVYLPGKNYSRFYDGISNVNQLRMVFNTCLDQHLPLLKDSTIDVRH